MKSALPLPTEIAQAVEFLRPDEQRALWVAATLMADSRGLMLRLTSLFGRRIDALRSRVARVGGRFGGEGWDAMLGQLQATVEDTLWRSYGLATFGLDAVPVALRPKAPRSNGVHRMAATASGIAAGFVGLPAMLFDIPFTTATILRSIAEIARDFGEDLAAEETRRACLEVLAFGGPNDQDDEAEIGYWATRLGMNHVAIHLLIRSAASRFGVVLSDKLLAQAVPLVGAVAGGALNYSFTEYYQSMARVQFCLRALDRATGKPEEVRRCFAVMVRAARERRRISRDPVPTATYLPRATEF